MDRVLRERVGIGLAEAERWDVRRFFRGSGWDDAFPADRMLPALRGTLSGLGIDLDAQRNVHLDVEERPTKSPRAFCAPIEIPDKVMLVIQPQGGPDDWYALFHEAGHTEHFAFTDPNLKMEEKRLGDNAVTEGWAMLFDHLIDDRAWLSSMLSFPRPDVFAAEGAVQLLFYVRRYCAKLLYEIEFHAAPDVTQMRSRYVEILGDALKVEPSPTDYLADIDSGYYVTSYLRAWAFSAQMTNFMREEFGTDWFKRREAGSLLVELWRARAEAECRRAAEGRHRRRGRDGSRRRARPLGDPDSRLERPARRRRRARVLPASPTASRARKSSISITLSCDRSTTVRSAPIDETSSRCSCRNQCRNCSPTRSPSERASLARSEICSVTRFSCSSASRTGSTTSANSVCGSATPGIATRSSASSRYWTIIIA